MEVCKCEMFYRDGDDVVRCVDCGREESVVVETKALRAEVARLQAIVARLPRTADGVPVTPGQKLFHRLRARRYISDAILYADRDFNFGEGDEHIDNLPPRVSEDDRVRVDMLYSTRSAAEAAMKKEGV